MISKLEKLVNRQVPIKIDFNICKMPRQTGKSTTCVSYLLHYAVFNDSVNIGILANKAATAKNFSKVTDCIRELA